MREGHAERGQARAGGWRRAALACQPQAGVAAWLKRTVKRNAGLHGFAEGWCTIESANDGMNNDFDTSILLQM